MPKPLVIVESPAKARTLARFLGQQIPRRGQLRSHPRPARVGGRSARKEIKGKSWGRLGVDTDGDFTPYYVVPADKKKIRHGAEGGDEGRLGS